MPIPRAILFDRLEHQVSKYVIQECWPTAVLLVGNILQVCITRADPSLVEEASAVWSHSSRRRVAGVIHAAGAQVLLLSFHVNRAVFGLSHTTWNTCSTVES